MRIISESSILSLQTLLSGSHVLLMVINMFIPSLVHYLWISVRFSSHSQDSRLTLRHVQGQPLKYSQIIITLDMVTVMEHLLWFSDISVTDSEQGQNHKCHTTFGRLLREFFLLNSHWSLYLFFNGICCLIFFCSSDVTRIIKYSSNKSTSAFGLSQSISWSIKTELFKSVTQATKGS